MEEKPIITFSVTQRNIVAIFIILVTGMQGGNLYFNWSTNIAMAKIEATLPLTDKRFEELKALVSENDKTDNKEHKEMTDRIYHLEMFLGTKRKTLFGTE